MSEELLNKDTREKIKAEKLADPQYRKLVCTPIPKLILSLGLPTTISMLVTNIYNLADTFFVSDISTSASGSIGIVFALMAILQAFGFMYGHGAGSNIGRLLGAGKKEKATEYATTSIIFGLITGVLIGVFGLVFQKPFMYFLGSTDTILPYACEYSRFILYAAPFMVTSCIMNNILRYEGKATFAMFGLVSGGILNIVGDYVFVKVLDLGVTGAGMSTAISQLVGATILLMPFITGKTQSKFRFKGYRLDPKTLGSIIAIGAPSLMRQGLASVSTMLLNKTSKPFGDEAIAAMSIVSKIMGFLFCVGLGVGQGFQPVAGYNYGAKRYDRVKKAYWFTLCFGIFTLSVMGAIGFILSDSLIGLFRDDPSVIEIGTKALRWQTLSLVFLTFTVTGNMLFQSLGRSKTALFLAACRSGLFFIPTLVILSGLFGLAGIEISPAVADVLAAVVTLPIVVSYLKTLPETDPEYIFE